MSGPEDNLEGKRATRNAARGAFAAHVARLKGDVAAHGGVVGKARDEAGKRLLDAGKQGLAIAGESKGIVAGTVAALGLWFLRKPLIAAARSHFGKQAVPAQVQEAAVSAAQTDQEQEQ